MPQPDVALKERSEQSKTNRSGRTETKHCRSDNRGRVKGKWRSEGFVFFSRLRMFFEEQSEIEAWCLKAWGA